MERDPSSAQLAPQDSRGPKQWEVRAALRAVTRATDHGGRDIAHDIVDAAWDLVFNAEVTDFTVKQVVEASGIALMHTLWTISGEPPRKQYAIEVARRQPDGSWKWLIGDPFTIDREHGERS